MPKAYVVTDELIEQVLALASDVEAQRTYAARLEADNEADETRYQTQAGERTGKLRALEERHHTLTRANGALGDKLARNAELVARFDTHARDYSKLTSKLIGGTPERIAAYVLAGDWAGLDGYLAPFLPTRAA